MAFKAGSRLMGVSFLSWSKLVKPSWTSSPDETRLSSWRPVTGTVVHPSRRINASDAKALTELVGSALAQIGGKVGRVGGAAAIAENKDLPLLAPRLSQEPDQTPDRVQGYGFMGRFLSADVVREPFIQHALRMDWGRPGLKPEMGEEPDLALVSFSRSLDSL